MALNAKYISTSDLLPYFVDKNTGLPLAAGVISFFEANAQNTPKPVYQITGTYPDYGYESLGSVLILSSVGTFVNGSGQPVIPFYYPYAGDPADESNVLDYYYITIVSAGNVLQKTLEPWPPIASSTTPANDGAQSINYVPNGQFWAHNNNPPAAVTFGTNQVTDIAPGGWQFAESTGATGTYNTSFITIAPNNILVDVPRYGLRFTGTTIGTEQVHDVRIRWPDVNTFSAGARNPGDVVYTFMIAATAMDSQTHTFDLRLICNYGAGGSAEIDVSVGTLVVGITYSYIIQNNIGFLNNATKTIGPGDFVALAIRSPQSNFDVTFTDAALFYGNVEPTQYPVTTVAHTLSEGIAGWMPTPNPDGSDIYLPLVLTASGLGFSDAEIGSIYASMLSNAQLPKGMLICDGSKLDPTKYSSDGVPYSRLFKKWYNPSIGPEPYFGTGPGYLTANFTNLTVGPTMRIATNTVGAATFSAGTLTGIFTFHTITPGVSTNLTAYIGATAYIEVVANAVGTGTFANGSPASPCTFVQLASTAGSYYRFSLVSPAASSYALSGGVATYFQLNSANNTAPFFMYFQIDGAGTVPGGSGTPIPLNIISASTFSAAEMSRLIRYGLQGNAVEQITCSAGSAITGGQYFSITTPTPNTYYVWYTVDGVGTDPFPATSIDFKIPVAVLSSDNSTAVATKTLNMINSKYYALPALQGAFLRGADPNAFYDVDYAMRLSTTDNFQPQEIGSIQYDQYQSHAHNLNANAQVIGAASGTGSGTLAAQVILTNTGTTNEPILTGNTDFNGGNETHPINVYVNYFVKY